MATKNFTYTLQIDAEIKSLETKLQQAKEEMNQFTKGGKNPQMINEFNQIEQAITKLKTKAAAPITSQATFGSMQRDIASAKTSLSGLESSITHLQSSTDKKMELIDKNTLDQIRTAESALDTFNNTIAEASQKSEKLVAAEEKLTNAKQDLNRVQKDVNKATLNVQGTQTQITNAQKEIQATKEKIKILKQWQEVDAKYTASGAAGTKSKEYQTKQQNAKDLGMDISTPAKLDQAIQSLNATLDQEETKLNDLNNTYKKQESTLEQHKGKLSVVSGAVDKAQADFDDLNNGLKNNQAAAAKGAYDALRNTLVGLGGEFSDLPTEYTEQNLEDIKNKCQQLKTQGLEGVDAKLDQFKTSVQEAGTAADTAGDRVSTCATDFQKLDEQASQTRAFMSRIQQFVGLEGAVMAARRAFQDAFQSIKDLDAAMTEMSVVTDTDISGYWDQLPQYTERANEMGLAIKDVYEADTLFYQQGLKQAEVLALSTETMKMARIAGLETAEATDRMTAALRGFNMELNETNAQRVADVYSELAAITASDVDEISSAMTKTASIASNAGMEFETTAAFLSQIIETTRESAETAGTALKTVIARFQELKKDPAEIGEVDGEVVDANKIETALRSVGVALRDTNGQFRELDDVFLELAGKWDSLDTNTQRYIATIAAGSRQQSRFIAMMSDYGRTQELVSAANASAGASNEQFEKTMESLSTKLNRLRNAWNSFTMSIMDNGLLKAGVEMLTKLLTVVNKFTDSLGKFSGAAKVMILVTALYLGDKALKAFLASFSTSKSVFTAFGAAAKGTFTSVKADIDTMRAKFNMFSASVHGAGAAMKVTFGPAQQAAANNYRIALDRLNKIQAKKAAMEAQGITSGTNYALITGMEARAVDNLSLKETLLKQALNLTDAEYKEAQWLVGYGITLDKAATLTKNEKAMAILREKAALDGLNKEQMENIMQNTAAELLEGTNRVDNFGMSLTKLGDKLKNFNAKNFFGSMGTGLKNLGKGFVSAAKSMLKFLASCGPLLVALAALAGAIILLVQYIKKLKSQTPEAKLKRAGEAAAKAAEAAEQAAEAYEHLNSSLEELDDKYDGLKDLIKGTKEWNKAVKDINKSVVDLIQEYPELAEFYEADADGILRIKEGQETTVQAIVSQKEQAANSAQAASIASNISVAKAQDDVAYKALSNEAKMGSQEWKTTGEVAGTAAGIAAGAAAGAAIGAAFGGVGAIPGAVIGVILGIAGGIAGGVGGHALTNAMLSDSRATDDRRTREVAVAMSSGNIKNASDKDEVAKWLQTQYHLTADQAERQAVELANSSEKLIAFGREIEETETTLNTYHQAMATAAAQIAGEGKSAKDRALINNFATDDYNKAFYDKAFDAISGLSENAYKEAAEKAAKEIYGDTATIDKNGNVTYGEDDNKQTIGKEEFIVQWAGAEANDDVTNALKQLPYAIESLLQNESDTSAKALRNVLQDKTGKTTTVKDLKELQKYQKGDAKSEAKLENMWNQLTTVQKEAFGSRENFLNNFWASIESSKKESEYLTFAFNELGLSLPDWEMTLGSGVTIIDKLSQLAKTATEEEFQKIESDIDQAFNKLSDNEELIFSSVLGSFDWTDASKWAEFPQALKEAGLAIDQLGFDVYEFAAQASKASNAILKFTAEETVKAAKNLSDLFTQINNEAGNRNVSKETYELLSTLDPELANDFVITADGYYYLGQSMTDLTEAVKNNTSALLGENPQDIQEQLNIIDALNMAQDESNTQVATFNDYISTLGSMQSDYDTAVSATQNAQGVLDRWEEDPVKATFAYFTKEAGGNWARAIGPTILAGFFSSEAQEKIEKEDMRKIISENAPTIQNYEDYRDNNKPEFGKDWASDATDIEHIPKEQLVYIFEQMVASGNVNLSKSGIPNLYNETQFKTVSEEQLRSWYSQLLTLKSQEPYLTNKLNEPDSEKIGAQAAIYALGSVQSIKAGFEETPESPLPYKIAAMSKASQYGVDESLISDFTQGLNTDAFWKALGFQEKFASAKKVDTISQSDEYEALWRQEQKIAKFTEDRVEAEKRYNEYLEDGTKTITETAQAQHAYIEALRLENDEQQKLITDIKTDSKTIYDTLQSQLGLDIDLSDYLTFDKTTGSVALTDKYDELTGTAKEIFDSYYKVLSDNEKTIKSAEEAIESNTKAQKDEIKQAKDQTSSLYNQVKDALIADRQREIDALQDINDSINEANEEMLDSMREQIDEQRKARENEKAAENIMDLETRLAYLKMDTTGGNALEIAELEKQLADEKQSYEDSLVDQSLDNLEAANEKAAKQREKQIEIAEQQLEEYQNSEQIWTDVKNLIDLSVDQMNNGIPAVNTAVGSLLREDNKLNNPNPFETEQWEADLKEALAAVKFYQDTTKGLIDTNAGDIDDLEGSVAGLKSELNQLRGETPQKTTNGAPIIQQVKVELSQVESAKPGDKFVEIQLQAYKSGGLADHTGPAWLDGTKARPELVLNQQDTQNFIALKDILSDVMKNAPKISQQKEVGDNYFDIEIKVDSIENDYDVDQLADRIRELIYQDATYRNVNVVNQKY